MAESKNENLGCGILLVILGGGIIAQRMGWFQFNTEWLLPLGLIGWGFTKSLKPSESKTEETAGSFSIVRFLYAIRFLSMKMQISMFLFPLSLVAFSDAGLEALDWYSVNDSVMGGSSVGGPVKVEEGTVRFAGILSLENNGGFSSIRAESDGVAFKQGKDLLLKVRGDGRKYYFDLRTSKRQRAFSYRQAFQTKAGQLMEIRLPLAGFYATSFGRRIPEAKSLNPSEVRSIGVTISDKTPGPFRLDLLAVDLIDPVLPKIPSVAELLQFAIQRGVPLYNRGDADACAAIYETALTALLLLPEKQLGDDSREIVQSILSASAAMTTADDKAWTLRRGIDQLLK